LLRSVNASGGVGSVEVDVLPVKLDEPPHLVLVARPASRVERLVDLRLARRGDGVDMGLLATPNGGLVARAGGESVLMRC
jgi:hypothetical protein